MRHAVVAALVILQGCTGAVSDLDAGSDAGSAVDAGESIDSGTGSIDAGIWDGGSVRDAGTYLEPAWHIGIPLNTWTEIPNTSGAGGAHVDAWGALAENKLAAELYIAASGGHSDSADNRVVSMNLLADAPVWVQRHASSANPVVDVLYYPDGLPTSRHLYAHLHYLPTLEVVLLGGCRYGYGGGTPTGPGMDAFDLTTNEWIPRGTFPDITPFNAYVIEVDGTGAAWSASGNKFDPVTRTWSTPGSGTGLGRFPHATAPARNLMKSRERSTPSRRTRRRRGTSVCSPRPECRRRLRALVLESTSGSATCRRSAASS